MLSVNLGSFDYQIHAGAYLKPFYIKVGRPFLLPGTSAIDMSLYIGNATEDAQACAGLLFMDARPDLPEGAPTPVGSYASTSGAATQATYTHSTGNQMYAQPVVLATLSTSGGNPGTVEGRLSVSARTFGGPLGRARINCQPQEDSTHPSLYPIGGWVPKLGISEAQAAIIATDVSNMKWQLYARLANDPSNPGTLQALGSATNFTDGNSAVNTGGEDVTAMTGFSTNHLFQLFLALAYDNSGGNPTGFFDVTAARIDV